MLKQVILMRSDISLSKGKAVSQGCHSSVRAVRKTDENVLLQWENEDYYKPDVGEVIRVKYAHNNGVGISASAETVTGRVMKVYEDDEGNFKGYKMSVDASSRIQTDDWNPELKVYSKYTYPHVYLIPEKEDAEQRKLTSVEGKVEVDEIIEK